MKFFKLKIYLSFVLAIFQIAQINQIKAMEKGDIIKIGAAAIVLSGLYKLINNYYNSSEQAKITTEKAIDFTKIFGASATSLYLLNLYLKNPLAFKEQIKKVISLIKENNQIIGMVFTYLLFKSLPDILKRVQQGSPSKEENKAQLVIPSTVKETLKSVAGNDYAKKEVNEIIKFLKNPKEYLQIGAKLPKGILLIGGPGNGKTLLSRAIAGEAGCPFFSISGSDFVEKFVGVGASRVRELFKEAKKKAPCIIFIDEIDAVGAKRSENSNTETNNTLNQLLVEMDGFNISESPIIVLAATNRPTLLDSALTRPGRFDRHIELINPNYVGRKEILELYSKNTRIHESLDLDKIAKLTLGFSGADLQNIVNEAAINAASNGKNKINSDDFKISILKLLAKKDQSKIISDQERSLIACHESGHALARILLRNTEEEPDYFKVSITQTGKSIEGLLKQDKLTFLKEDLIKNIQILLAGYSAEQIMYKKVSSCYCNDYKLAVEIATKLAEFELVKPEESREKIIERIIKKCYEQIQRLLLRNKTKLKKLRKTLINKEIMYTLDIQECLKGIIEPESLA